MTTVHVIARTAVDSGLDRHLVEGVGIKEDAVIYGHLRLPFREYWKHADDRGEVYDAQFRAKFRNQGRYSDRLLEKNYLFCDAENGSLTNRSRESPCQK